jgi:hypothetical protein
LRYKLSGATAGPSADVSITERRHTGVDDKEF